MSARFLAPLSLAIATLLFFATLPWKDVFAVGLLHAFAEASMIGGLADWFAVVALFRHPFGIPIPHTAIIPKQREKLTRGITDVVQNLWLKKESILERMQSWNIAALLLSSLGSAHNRDTLRALLRMLLAETLGGIDARSLARGVEGFIRSRLRAADLAALLRKGVGTLRGSDLEQRLLEQLGRLADQWLREQRVAGLLASSLRSAADNYATSPLRRVSRWMAERSNVLNYDELSSALLAAARQDIADMIAQQEHPLRASFDELLARFAEACGEDPMLRRGIDDLWSSLTAEGTIAAALDGPAQRALAWLADDLRSADSLLLRHADGFIESRLARLRDDPSALASLDRWLKDRIGHVIETRHEEIGAMVRGNLDRLSTAQLVAQIEEKVGGDLQYIRVNGAVVGGLVGAALYVLQRFL